MNNSVLTDPVQQNIASENVGISYGGNENNDSFGQTFVQTTTAPEVSFVQAEPYYGFETPRVFNSSEIGTSNLIGASLSLEFDPDQFATAFADFDFDIPTPGAGKRN